MLTRVALALAVAALPLFASHDTVALELKAPFNELFDRSRSDDRFAVDGTLSYTAEGSKVAIDGVRVSVRGHTSRNEHECAFPKLKIALPDGASPGPLLHGMRSIKIGTHCGEAGDDEVSVKYGRLPNELSPLREAFVYRLLDALGVPTLKARPAQVTYRYADPRSGQTPPQDEPVVRHALIIEDDSDAIARLGGRGDIAEDHVHQRTRAVCAG